MADILLSFGVATTDSDVSEIRKGLDTIITKIEKNPPKVRVGLTVDNDALNHFKKELEAILNTVSLANGAPITLNISGLGEISAQATQAKKSLDNLKKSGSGTGSAFNEAKKAINGYFKALADVDKRLGRDIYFDSDAGKWTSTTKEFQYLADALTEAEQRFNTFASAEARAALTIEQQAALVRAETDAYNKYGISVEDAWKKAQAAADKAQAAADKSATQAALKAESAALTEATAAAKNYYDLLTKLKTGDYQIAFDGQTFSSAVAGNEEFVASLNRALEAYKKAKEGFSSLSTESQEQFLRDVTSAVHDYNLAVEEKANKDRKAAEAAQAAADKSATQAALKAESAAYKEAADAVTAYYSILTKVNTGDNDIAFDGSKFVSESGDYKELAASLTKAADAYRLVRESASSLSDDSQLQLLQLISQEIQKYNVAIEQKANKDRQAAQAAAEAAAAESRKREEYLSSAEAVNSQISRLDTIIKQTESNLEKWTKARGGKTSDNYKAIEQEVEALKQMRSQLASTGKAMDDFDSKVGNSTATIKTNSTAIKDANEDTKSLSDKWGSLAEKFGSWLTVSQAIMAAIRTVKKMVSTVVELDSAMTELKKVTDETDATYERFLTKAADRAKALGASISDVVSASADFARLGYNVDDAAKLADIALMYQNIGDGVEDVTQASESIVSTMQAFGILPDQAMHIVDVFNSIGNNFAISSGGIGEALQRSAAAMNAAGNTLEETAALVAAANTVVQNPDSVGTTLKTVSMFLRASKVEAEEAGESTEGMANSVSELREQLLALTNGRVDILTDSGQYKSTYEILKDIASVWDDIVSNQGTDSAAILELIGGKRNANVVAAILENFEIAEDALSVALNSTGSAIEENEKHLDSIAGRIGRFQAAWESLSATVVNGDLVKGIVSFGTTLLNVINGIVEFIGGLEGIIPLIPAVLASLMKFEKVQTLFGELKKTFTSFVGGAKRCPFECAHYTVVVTLNEP